jgi:aryl-alcohol dehydrogenase-like predicted oxidoreductase
VDEATSHRILDRAFEAGINFYDTAENYPVPPDAKWAGRCEEIVGRWLKTKDRDAVIVATKVCGPSHGWIQGSQRAGMTALDRHNITRALEASLKRLGTDYVDLYQTHWPDHGTAYDETMETLDELIRAGKVRIVGCSNETTWGLMKSLAASERLGVARYQTIQNNFSLNNRRFEDELAAACRHEGVSLIPYSPLAGGVLSGKYNDGARPEGDHRRRLGRGPPGRHLRRPRPDAIPRGHEGHRRGDQGDPLPDGVVGGLDQISPSAAIASSC